MLGIDTNVLVRLLIRDDETQFKKAIKLVEREAAAQRRVFINHIVLLETEWVLRSRYALSKDEIVQAFSGLLDASDFQIQDESIVEETLFTWKDSTADFADCLIAASNRRLGCRGTATFEIKAAKLPGFYAM